MAPASSAGSRHQAAWVYDTELLRQSESVLRSVSFSFSYFCIWLVGGLSDEPGGRGLVVGVNDAIKSMPYKSVSREDVARVSTCFDDYRRFPEEQPHFYQPMPNSSLLYENAVLCKRDAWADPGIPGAMYVRDGVRLSRAPNTKNR